MSPDLWRYIALADLIVLISAGAYLHIGYRELVGPAVWRAGLAVGAFLGIAGVGIVTNLIASPPVTPAAYILAIGGAGCALYVLAIAVRLARH